MAQDARDATAAVASGTASTWDRLSNWYADNKVAAWTIAGVTVVAVGGTVYYLSRPPPALEGEKKGKNKRKAKKKDE